MRREIAATLRSVVRNRSSARCMRHSLRYLIGETPRTSRNRWSSTDLETAAVLASSATVHLQYGSAWSAAIAGASTRSCSRSGWFGGSPPWIQHVDAILLPRVPHGVSALQTHPRSLGCRDRR